VDLRIFRVALNLPNDKTPGAGLPAYMLIHNLPGESLVISRKKNCSYKPTGENIRVELFDYPDSELGCSKGIKRFGRIIRKGAGYILFFLKSVLPMIAFKPNLTHIHTPVPFLQGLFGKYFLRTPLCITLHGSEFLHIKKSRFWRWVLARADHVFYVSRLMKNDLESFINPSRMSYLPNGVDHEQFKPGNGIRRDIVFMAGTLRWQKDYSTALRAFKMFLKRFPTWQLHIAGEGTLQAELKKEAGLFEIDDKVEFLGMLSRGELALRMQRARIFLLSSVSEGFPKVILEASASATPIVVTDVGDCGLIGGRAGIVVPPKDPEAIAKALSTLAGDNACWRKCSIRAKETAYSYSWNSMARGVLTVYKQLLSSANRT